MSGIKITPLISGFFIFNQPEKKINAGHRNMILLYSLKEEAQMTKIIKNFNKWKKKKD